MFPTPAQFSGMSLQKFCSITKIQKATQALAQVSSPAQESCITSHNALGAFAFGFKTFKAAHAASKHASRDFLVLIKAYHKEMQTKDEEFTILLKTGGLTLDCLALDYSKAVIVSIDAVKEAYAVAHNCFDGRCFANREHCITRSGCNASYNEYFLIPGGAVWRNGSCLLDDVAVEPP